MNFWRWLTTPDPEPGFTRRKLGRLFLRVMLFTLLATVLSALLRVVGLGPYLDTWWGTLLFVLALYIPLSRFLNVDTFAPRRVAGTGTRPGTATKGKTSAERRKERNRYAGVRKGPPNSGRRR